MRTKRFSFTHTHMNTQNRIARARALVSSLAKPLLDAASFVVVVVVVRVCAYWNSSNTLIAYNFKSHRAQPALAQNLLCERVQN